MNVSDDEIQKLLVDMDVLAQYALQKAREDQRRQDAQALASIIYDIYINQLTPDNKNEKM